MIDWTLDELAHAGHEHLDPSYVATYEAKAGYDAEDDLAVLRELGFGHPSTIVDLGAGTGRFALAAARECSHVVAVDVSPAMVDVLRRRVGAGRVSNVTVVQAGFLTYEHVGDPAPFVFSRNALHQIPDFWKGIALARIAAMMSRGGVLRLHDLVDEFEAAEAAERIPAWFAGAVDDPSKGYTAEDLAEHVRTEHSTYSWLLEAMLERIGFDIVDRRYVRNAYGSFTCRRR